MLYFIWKSWRRHKERLILMLIGALIISSGLSYLLGLSESNKGTIMETLRKNWKAQYDILVRPPGSRSLPEKKDHLLSPNYLSGLSGGISLAQWHKIENMKDISVAAPVSVVGFASYDVKFGKANGMNLDPQAIYQLKMTTISNNGYRKVNAVNNSFYATSNIHLLKNSGYHFSPLSAISEGVRGFGDLFLVGVDPIQEAKLSGLNHAVISKANSRYFSSNDTSQTEKIKDHQNGTTQFTTTMPVLLSKSIYYHTTFQYTLEKVKIPKQDQGKVGMLIKSKGKAFLKHLPRTTVKTFKINSGKSYQKLLAGLLSGNANSRDSNVHLETSLFKAGGVSYRQKPSPFPKKWHDAYEVKPQNSGIGGRFVNAFRKIRFPNERINKKTGKVSLAKIMHFIHPQFIGVFNPSRLKISKNPLTKLPMQTYRPPTAKLVLNAKGNPVNPPATIRPKDVPTSFLLEPPEMLTTVQAASQILGKKPISAIRIKVKGVHELNGTSEKKLKDIAKQIEQQTDLIADITLGSSPEPVLVHVPATKNQSALGWVQMPWINIGASYSIYKQTKIGFSGILASVMLVAIAYVFATTLVSFLARRKEFAVLSAVGWRPSNLVKMVVYESFIVGLLVAIISWGIEAFYYTSHAHTVSAEKGILAGCFGILIYLLGAIGPAVLASRISPHEAMRTGEIRSTSRRIGRSNGMVGMSFHHWSGKMGRNVLSVFAMVFPTMLLALFLFVTIHLKGVLYTSWLGQYAALQVGPSNYIAMGIALVIAILTTAEIMWQNVAERKPEIALLKAVGWRDGKVCLLVFLEAAWTGVLAGVISILFAFGIIMIMYHKIPIHSAGLIAATGIIPIGVAILGSILPAEIAVRIRPSLGMKER